MRPTKAGTVRHGHAEAVLSAFAAAEHEVAGLRDRIAGRIVVGAFPTATAVVVPRTIARVTAAHPALTIVLYEGPSPSLVKRVRDGRIEVAVIGIGVDLPPYDLDGLRVSAVAVGELQLAVAADQRFAYAVRGWPTRLGMVAAGLGIRGSTAALPIVTASPSRPARTSHSCGGPPPDDASGPALTVPTGEMP